MRVRGKEGEHEAIVLDASTRGLQVRTVHPPARGEYVELLVCGQWLVGTVRWNAANRFGVSLRERISVPVLLAQEEGPILLSQHGQAVASDTSRMALALRSVLMGGVIGAGGFMLVNYTMHGLGFF